MSKCGSEAKCSFRHTSAFHYPCKNCSRINQPTDDEFKPIKKCRDPRCVDLMCLTSYEPCKSCKRRFKGSKKGKDSFLLAGHYATVPHGCFKPYAERNYEKSIKEVGNEK